MSKLVKDIIERVLTTFVQGFAAAWIVVEGGGYDELFSVENLKVGVAAGTISLAKNLIASHLGNKDSASLATEV